jgi:ABC-type phosphate/phosphonate transport system substrate-binding protein
VTTTHGKTGHGGLPLIATLPMYCWPENQAEVDAQWARFHTEIVTDIQNAPQHLSLEGSLEERWLSPRLLFGQTCSYPLATILAGKVRYIATPSYQVAGCEARGTYRSVIIAPGNGKVVAQPGSDIATLPELAADAVFAFNTPDSMSGLHGPTFDYARIGAKLPERRLETGSHRQSLIAVAKGEADYAALDCVTWAMAQTYEPLAKKVDVIGWTETRPGLPFICSANTSDAHLAILRRAAIRCFDAVVLKEFWRF